MTDAFDLLAQARWEAEGVRRAAKRYEEAAAATDPAALPSGQKLLREVVPPLAARIDALKAEALETIGAAGGRKGRWIWPIQALDSRALALLTIAPVMGTLRAAPGTRDAVLSVSKAIGMSVRDEIDYRAWVATQIAANKVAKEAQDFEHKDLLRALKSRYPSVNRTVWARWKRKLHLTMEEPWDQATEIELGAALLSALLEVAPDRFTRELVRSGGKTQARVVITPETAAIMADVEQSVAVSRPQHMPMLIPPIPWAYE